MANVDLSSDEHYGLESLLEHPKTIGRRGLFWVGWLSAFAGDDFACKSYILNIIFLKLLYRERKGGCTSSSEKEMFQ